MKKSKVDFVIIGSMLSNDIILASHLFNQKYKVLVAREIYSEVKKPPPNTSFPAKHIIYFKNRVQLLKIFYRAKIIICLSGSILLYLKHFFLIFPLLRLPKFINIPTGSDLTELAVESSIRGYLYRKVLKFAAVNLIGTYPNMIKNLIKLKNINFHFSRFPYATLDISDRKKIIKRKENSPLIFFHPSNIDWNADDIKSRNSFKGSNKFINAFIRALKEGLDARCIILFRGIDKEKAKIIIKDSGYAENFIWKNDLSREEFFYQIQESDVIVDQFSIGTYGGITVESMSYGKPAICYIHKLSSKLLYYDDMPPVFNCYTEEEIYEVIKKCQDRDLLLKKGQQAKDWAHRNHNWKFYLIHIILFYDILTGNQNSKFINKSIDQ